MEFKNRQNHYTTISIHGDRNQKSVCLSGCEESEEAWGKRGGNCLGLKEGLCVLTWVVVRAIYLRSAHVTVCKLCFNFKNKENIRNES